MEDKFYTSLVGADQAYWLGAYRKENETRWRNGKGKVITNYGVYGDLDRNTPWNKPDTGVLEIPDDHKIAIGNNSEWFAVRERENGQDTEAITICTYVCRNYRTFP